MWYDNKSQWNRISMAGMKSHRKSNSKRELKPELGREEEIYRNGYVLDIVENYVNWKVSDG